ncbi:LysR family transcriptional regulator [Enterobacter hormaechei]
MFSAVAEQAQFASAAQSLSMPTSNVSRAIKQLEQQLNCRLIDRTTRKMRLTEQGKILYQQAKKTLYELDNVVEHITSDGPLGEPLDSRYPVNMVVSYLPYFSGFCCTST